MKLKGIPRMLLTAEIVAACCLVSGCAWSIGGSERKEGTAVHQNTRGQELIDLKRARDQGALTEDEYQEQRKRIMEK
jgi:hypothetical protein